MEHTSETPHRRRRSARREQGPPNVAATTTSSPDQNSGLASESAARELPQPAAASPTEAPVGSKEKARAPRQRESKRSRHRAKLQALETPAPTPQGHLKSPEPAHPETSSDGQQNVGLEAVPVQTEHGEETSDNGAPELQHLASRELSPREQTHRQDVSKQEPYREQTRHPRDRRAEIAERALRGLVTTRGTQVTWSAALRARSLAQPSAADIAEAETDLVIVRRNYTPAQPLPASKKPERQPRR
ncbi:hypothetical protein EH165_09260 [Nakamurella antarctica]|uniref:Uncharacterized protein n=1 Tax=Nakamurella antarctica TaxID=1902245 RepID=A0A3G8ZNB5_9ACTN|nr:hypothetical protein [Nakamurella antarctica]AZI58297.1 hypothetical protein EH165_09260 [Nakamurella antarctica]